MKQAACSCGQLRVDCDGEPLKVSICHCDACRLRTGSAFGIAVFYPRDAVTAQGEQRDHMRKADSGRNVTFHFCPQCGSSVWWEPDRMPDRVAGALGAFADAEFPMPDQSVNDARRYKWIEFPDALQKRVE
jgi:hypothetical protein